MKKLLPIALFFLKIFANPAFGQVSTSNGNGDWNDPTTWLPVGVPPTNQNIIIRASDSVWINSPTQIVNDITINGILTVNNLASADLTFDGNLTINGKLYNNGYVEMVTMGKNFVMGPGSFYQHNPKNSLNVQLFTRGVENFAPTSTLVIMNWDDESIPLGSASRVTSDFGNVVLSYNSATVWEQRGRFGPPGNPNRVKGSFTVTAGLISMDDGTSSPTTALTLQNVLITGTGQIVFQKGQNRNLTLITGNFTDNSTNPLPSVIMQNSYGTLNWTVNGNLNISHPFIGIEGTSNESATGRLTVNGDFNITGGSFEFCTRVNALTEITVNGNTTISGPVTKVRFNDGNNMDMNFITNDFVVSSCNDIVLLGGNYSINLPGGTPTVTINNDFILNGTCSVTILDSTTSTRKTRVNIMRDLISSSPNANLKLANNHGPVTLRVGRHLNYTGGNFIGQANNNSNGIDSIIVIGNFIYNTATASNYFRANYGTGNTFLTVSGNMSVLNSGTANGQGISLINIPPAMNMGTGQLNVTIGGTYLQNGGRFVGINRGAGALTFNCTSGLFDMNGGVFKGILNSDTISSGAATFNLLGIDYDGGSFVAHDGSCTSGPVLTVNITNDCKINFTSVTDQFRFIGTFFVQTSINILPLNLTVGGNMILSGVNGSFNSSHAAGTETILISGNLNVSGGVNNFNVYPNSGFMTNGHLVNMTVNGQVNISGGVLNLCAELGTLNATFSQNLNITNGNLVLKSGFGSGTLNINGSFTQTGGLVDFYKNSSFFNTLVVAMVVNADNDAVGDFTQTAGTISFSDNTSPSSAENILSIKSPNFTIGGNAIITSAGVGTSPVLGIIEFSRTGTTVFTRNIGSSHSVTQTRYIISSGATLDVVTGNLQLASHTNNAIIDMLKISSSGILWLRGTNQVYSNGTYPYCNIQTFNFSRIRIENPNGLYNGTNTAAFNAANNLNFSLATGNVVEYRGFVNQVVTGLGVGVATLPQHKYGALEINHQGVPGINYVYPSANLSVFVKYQLILTQGEFNLDPDNNPATLDGRAITIESASTLAINRTNGYIKSETRDGSAAVRWFMGSATGTRTIPFGYDPANYIPFKLTSTSGTVDTVTMATYRTPAPDNLPYPPTVLHVNDISGVDNSLQTVDRFWFVNVKGSVASVNYEFNYVPAEAALLSGSPRAQKWMLPSSIGWSFPYPGVQSNIVNGVVANGITNKSGWWTLSSITSPLPVELLGFEAKCFDNQVSLEWIVASEKENSHFSILKSSDGKSFNLLAEIEGKGNSSSTAFYNYRYSEAAKGIFYYRLLQTDFSGVTTELKTIAFNNVCTSNNDELSLQVYGNQALATVSEEGNYTLVINDATGRILDFKRLNSLKKGVNLINLNTDNFSEGVYLIRLNSAEGRQVSTRFFIAR
jgi:hypothetical protein